MKKIAIILLCLAPLLKATFIPETMPGATIGKPYKSIQPTRPNFILIKPSNIITPYNSVTKPYEPSATWSGLPMSITIFQGENKKFYYYTFQINPKNFPMGKPEIIMKNKKYYSRTQLPSKKIPSTEPPQYEEKELFAISWFFPNKIFKTVYVDKSKRKDFLKMIKKAIQEIKRKQKAKR